MSSRGERSSEKQLALRLSVPAHGGLRSVASEVATRLAAYLGSSDADAGCAGATIDKLAERVAPAGVDGDITFEFTEADGDLLISARCNGRSSEARCPLLPA